MELNADAVVIGGGAIGASIAFYLSDSGASVIVVEALEIAGGASGSNPGTIALVTKKPGLALDLTVRSSEMYRTLSQVLDCDIEYEVCGAMVIAETEAEWEFLCELANVQQQSGVNVDLLSPSDAGRLCPLIASDIAGASYCRDDAQVNPFLLTHAFINAARKKGVEFLTNTPVIGIQVEHNRVRFVLTPTQRIAADWVINAAGVHADSIAGMVGVSHGVSPRRGQMMVLEPQSGLPGIKLSSARQLLAKHRGDSTLGRLSFGYTYKPRSGTVLLGSTYEDVGLVRRTTTEATVSIALSAKRLVPRLPNLQVLRTWSGFRPTHPSGPVIAHGLGPEGYVAAVGHGGDGIATAPVTGELVARLLGAAQTNVARPETFSRAGTA